jgi:tetratricopeptide (TPR) repeat protein
VLALLAVGLYFAYPHLLAWYHYRSGVSALERYHNEDARYHLTRCLEGWPSSIEVRVLAARAARRADALGEAEQHLIACRGKPGEPAPDEVTLEWALLKAAMGDLLTVEEYLQARLAKDQQLAPLIWEGLAQGYTRMHRILDARACLNAWLELHKDNTQALFLRGEMQRQWGALEPAGADYQRVVDLDPQRDDARKYLAYCLLRRGRYADALTHLEPLRRRRGSDADLAVWQARCLAGLGRKDEACQVLDEVLRAQPSHGTALNERGQLELGAGSLAQAESWLRKAVGASPSDYRAHWALYQCLQQQGKTAEAKAQLAATERLKDRLERLKEIETHYMPRKPFDPELHCELGALHVKLGNEVMGERWLHSALRYDPDHKAAHAALADLYQARGDSGKAAFHRQLAGATTAKAKGPP